MGGRQSQFAGIRSAVEHQDLRRARALVEEALRRRPNDPELVEWQKVVAPAVVKAVRVQGPDRSQEFAWISSHSHEHAGRWVALCGDRLLAEAVDLATLLASVKRVQPERTPLVVWIA